MIFVKCAVGRRDFFEGSHQIARQQPVPKGLAQGAFRDLPCDGRRLLPRLTRRGGDERAEPAAHLDHAFQQQGPVGVLDGVRIQLEFGGELARSMTTRIEVTSVDETGDPEGAPIGRSVESQTRKFDPEGST